MSDEVSPTAKTDVEKMKELFIEAELGVKSMNQHLSEITNKSKTIDAALAKFDVLQAALGSADANKQRIQDDAERLTVEVDRILTEARADLNNVKEVALSVEQKVKAIDDFYPQFQNLKSEIENKDTGLSAILNQSTKLKTEIEQTKGKALNYLVDLEKAFESAQNKNQEIETFFASKFEPLRGRILDPENGVEIILKRLNSAQATSKNREERIQQYAQSSEQNKKATDEIVASAKLNLENIQASNKAGEGYVKNIKEVTELVTATGLANAFNKRKLELYSALWIWGGILVVSGSILAGLFGAFFLGKDSPVTAIGIIHRITVFSPVIFLVFFSARQYSRERSLLEEYSFKTAISSSFNAYTKLLTDNFHQEKFRDDILNFTLQSIEAIYRHPSLPAEVDVEAEINAQGMGGFRLRNFIKPNIASKADIKTRKQSKKKVEATAKTDVVA